MFDSEILTLIYVFVIGLLSGLAGATMGAGGLVTIPGLILLGLPPATAIGTNRLSALGLWITAFNRFRKNDKVVWKYVLPLCILAAIGGLAGAFIVLQVPEKLLKAVVGFFILLTLALMLFKKDAGISLKDVTPWKRRIGYFLYFLVAMYGGFFGGGVVALMVVILIFLFGFKIVEANATCAVPWIVLSGFCLVFFALHGLVDWYYGTVMTAGAIWGGHLGANAVIKNGDKWMKKIFIAGMALAALKLLYDSILT
ncbi:MAG: sulfite exporter TauE/SafE family protein [Pseudomonadota bacterium]|jgi:hypothetical protein|nr:sulfite exporter TauE/SafE family protein [Pseudomonadota bacterium]QKK06075.1 MAG: sulfite exporter TauE/SafE family protein [Pseudomonadota bacterium]